ncbi:MAG: hypothetical protein WD934_09390 [Gemmatimonadales bacterium]
MIRRLLPLALPVLLACETLTGTFGEVIALQVEGSTARRVEEGASLTLTATALDVAGSPVAADITWGILDTVPGITLDTVTGVVTGVTPGGPWRVQARVGDLRATAVAVTVAGAPDSVEAASDTIVTAIGPNTPFGIRVLDLTTLPGTPMPLAGVITHFRILDPTGAVRLRAPPAHDSTARDSVSLVSAGNGVVTAIALFSGTAPDSARVEATLTTALGGAVAGSPVRFLLRFP